PGMKGLDLATVVSTTAPYEWRSSVWDLSTDSHPEIPADQLPYHVVAYDYGVKRNILRMLVERGCRVTVLPAQTPASEALALNPDGVFLSNGPGDPEPCDYAIQAIREILETRIPVFGICLGHQLLALAAGARTVKMGCGHHGANHPVLDVASGAVLITSQNHGFCADEGSLPANVRVTHKSLFDGTLQGIEFTDQEAFGFQGHPEASPGLNEVDRLSDRSVAAMAARKGNGGAAHAGEPGSRRSRDLCPGNGAGDPAARSELHVRAGQRGASWRRGGLQRRGGRVRRRQSADAGGRAGRGLPAQGRADAVRCPEVPGRRLPVLHRRRHAARRLAALAAPRRDAGRARAEPGPAVPPRAAAQPVEPQGHPVLRVLLHPVRRPGVRPP